jgi:hypothetical protein
MKKSQIPHLLLNAPRHCPSYYYPSGSDFDTAKLWAYYKKQIPNFRKRDIGIILDTFHEEIFNELLNNRNGVYLPKNIGKLYIITRDQPKVGFKYLNYILSIGEKIGVLAFDYDVDKAGIIDGSMWQFSFSRDKMEIIKQKYKEDFMFYMNFFKRYKKNDKIFDIDSKKPYISVIENIENPLKNYNEFEM